jgi:trimethylamine--corrinoid protein Co-methyltransferase
MAKRILRGVTITPETLATEVIEKVGPGGHYLTQPHTRQHFKSETWFPTLIDRQMRRAWQAAGSHTMADRIRAKVLGILDSHEPQPIPANVEARLVDIVAEAEERHQE